MHRAALLPFALLMTATPAAAETIGFTVAKTDAFQKTLQAGVMDYAKTLSGVTVDLVNAEGVLDTQLQQVQAFADAKVDAIIVAPVDGDGGAKITAIAAKANIPLVYLNVEPANIEDLPANQTMVASNELNIEGMQSAGSQQAEAVCQALGGKGKVAIMVGEYFHAAARGRTQSARERLSAPDCQNIEIIEQQSANWSRDMGEQLVAEWLNAGVRPDAILANNDEMALGAINALKAASYPLNQIIVAGVDATPDARAAMEAGELDITVLQNARAQGQGGVDAAIKLAKGEELGNRIYVPFELVTPKNLAQYQPKTQ